MTTLVRMAITLVLLAIASAPLAQSAQEPKPFVRGSLDAIVASQAGKAFVLALWSLDCVYCRHDLAMLSRLKAEHPELRLVLVSTDTPARRGEIPPALDGIRLDAEESWIFADSFTERLRHQIDPRWHGELPRTYFYDAGGERIGISGKLNEDAVVEWIQAAYAPSP